MAIPILLVAINTDQDLIAARHRTKQIAALAGFAAQDQTRLITSVSELARNALQYAGGGRLQLSIDHQDGKPFLKATVSDSGGGIRDLNTVLSGGYVSKTGLGKGIVGSRNIADVFEIESSTDGTTVSIGKFIPLHTIVDAKVITAWLNQIGEQEHSPVQQLKEQNQQLLLALEELQRKTEQLDHKTEQLELASRYKSDFLTNMSHEMRTPLNAILGINRILGRAITDPEQAKLLRLGNEAGRTLLQLINDILDLSKVEAGKLTLENQSFRPADTVIGVVQMFTPQAKEKDVALEVDIAPRAPYAVLGDANRVRQVLINLVGNAIKFTDKGAVKISLDVHESGRLLFSVSDTGPGMSVEQQQRLFRNFEQLDSSMTRKHAGTGLGLAISKALVELMGGYIYVTSDVGAGSTFICELPLVETDAQVDSTSDPIVQEVNEEIQAYPEALVLLAEDHPVNQMVASMELEALGYKVDVVSTGKEAVEAVQNKQYAAVLMDCQMPEMDGYDASRAIRRIGLPVPIIAMTAHAMEGDKRRCLEAGMDDYISKPFETVELQRVLTKTLSLYKLALDKELLLKRFKKDQAIKILTRFCEQIESDVNGIAEAYGSGDFRRCSEIAHAAKSACGMVFADELSQLMAKVEEHFRQPNPENTSIVDDLYKATRTSRQSAMSLISELGA